MKTLEEARNALAEARAALKEYNTPETVTAMLVDDGTVANLAIRNTRKALIENIIQAEDELANAKKAEA